MKPRERVWAALERCQVDRIPRFEIWIDALLAELGQSDPIDAYVDFGQDGVLLPGGSLPGSPAWRDGTDEFGRVWRDGTYVGGAVRAADDLERYSPPSPPCAWASTPIWRRPSGAAIPTTASSSAPMPAL